MERIFELIARQIDSSFPSGERWHRELLAQMGQEQPGTRPPVLSADSIEKLDEFLAFRHRVRNIYTFNLDAERLYVLLERLPGAWQSARIDIEVFCDLLQEAMAEQDDQ